MTNPEIIADYIRLNELCQEMEENNDLLDKKMNEWLELG